MANIPIYAGSSSFFPGDTPFGFYDYDYQFQTDADKVTRFPFYVSNASASVDNSGDNVVNKYLLYVTEQITGSLETMSTGSTFEIVEIPTI